MILVNFCVGVSRVGNGIIGLVSMGIGGYGQAG